MTTSWISWPVSSQHHADELSSDAIISAIFITSQLPYIVFNVMQNVHFQGNLVGRLVVPYELAR